MADKHEHVADCCGDPCYYAESERGPCWGRIEVVDEEWYGVDWWWIHCCEGHADLYLGRGPYRPKPEETT